MNKYKNKIVRDLEKRLSNIDNYKKTLFLNKINIARNHVINIFCERFLKNEIAVNLFKRSISEKTRVPIIAATILSLHEAYYFEAGWLCLDTEKSALAISSLKWILNNLTGLTKKEMFDLDKLNPSDFVDDYLSEIDTEEKLESFKDSLKNGFRAILPVEIFYDYKQDDYSLIGTHGTTINISSIDFIKRYDKLSISIPTLSLISDFTVDNIGVFNDNIRNLDHIDESATILNEKSNTNNIDFLLKKFSVVYSGVFPATILSSNELEELVIFKEVYGSDKFNTTVNEISRKLI